MYQYISVCINMYKYITTIMYFMIGEKMDYQIANKYEYHKKLSRQKMIVFFIYYVLKYVYEIQTCVFDTYTRTN